MRTWRKDYSTILDSEQVSELSDGAAFLLTLLIVAQDDTGYWPWTPAKVRRLIASRPSWTVEKAQEYADELAAAKIAVWQNGGIVLVNGKDLNGTPRTDAKPEITPRIESGTISNEAATPNNEGVTPVVESVPPCIEVATPCNESVPPCIEVVPLEQSRSDQEKSRSDPPSAVAEPPPEEPPKLDNPERDPYDFQAFIARALEYGSEYPNKDEACRHAKAAINSKIKPQELVRVAEYMLEEDEFWEGKPLQIATLVKHLAAYRRAIKNGWKPGQKGPPNGRNGKYQGNTRARQSEAEYDFSGLRALDNLDKT